MELAHRVSSMVSQLFIVSGHSGAGKTTLVHMLKEALIAHGTYTHIYSIDERLRVMLGQWTQIRNTRANRQRLRENLQREYGNDLYLCELKALLDSFQGIVIWDGVRTGEYVRSLKNSLKAYEGCIIRVSAPEQCRLQRLQLRNGAEDPKTLAELKSRDSRHRDVIENLRPHVEMSNEGTLEELAVQAVAVAKTYSSKLNKH